VAARDDPWRQRGHWPVKQVRAGQWQPGWSPLSVALPAAALGGVATLATRGTCAPTGRNVGPKKSPKVNTDADQRTHTRRSLGSLSPSQCPRTWAKNRLLSRVPQQRASGGGGGGRGGEAGTGAVPSFSLWREACPGRRGLPLWALERGGGWWFRKRSAAAASFAAFGRLSHAAAAAAYDGA